MNGNVTYNGSQLLSGAINVNTTGNIQALNVQITENGERTITPPEGVDGYAPITIDTNVPIPEPVLDSISITQNGTYTPPSGTDGYDEITVNVPQLEPVLDDITITENGIYTPPTGVDGYDEITVNVSQDADIQPLTRTITTNGTTVINASDLNVDGFDPVTITTAVDGYTIKTLSNTPTPIASFNDGTDNPLKSLTASIKPVQAGSGDPSPTNVRPISGWTEEVITVSPLNISQLYNGQIYGDGSWISNPNRITNVTNSQDNSYFLKKGTYTLDFDVLTQGVRNVNSCSLLTKDENYNIIDNFADSWKSLPFTFTLTQDGYLYFTAQRENTNINPSDFRAKILGQTTTIPFTDGQGQSVEVFGGTLDVTSGVLTVDRVSITVDENSNIISGSGGLPFRVDLLTGAKASSSASALTGVKCNFLKEVTQSSPWGVDGTFSRVTTDAKIVYFKVNSEITTVQQLKTFLQSNNLQFVYELATPITYQLTPTAIKSLDGVNNVFASTGDVEELNYFADL